jgi:hypothetical protein
MGVQVLDHGVRVDFRAELAGKSQFEFYDLLPQRIELGLNGTSCLLQKDLFAQKGIAQAQQEGLVPDVMKSRKTLSKITQITSGEWGGASCSALRLILLIRPSVPGFVRRSEKETGFPLESVMISY